MSNIDTLGSESRCYGLHGFSAAVAIDLFKALAAEIVPVVALYIAPSGTQAVVRGLLRVTPNGGVVIYPPQPEQSTSGCIAVPLPTARDKCSYRKRQDLDDQTGAVHQDGSELLLTVRYERSGETLVLLVNRLYGVVVHQVI